MAQRGGFAKHGYSLGRHMGLGKTLDITMLAFGLGKGVGMSSGMCLGTSLGSDIASGMDLGTDTGSGMISGLGMGMARVITPSLHGALSCGLSCQYQVGADSCRLPCWLPVEAFCELYPNNNILNTIQSTVTKKCGSILLHIR